MVLTQFSKLSVVLVMAMLSGVEQAPSIDLLLGSLSQKQVLQQYGLVSTMVECDAAFVVL